MNLVVIRMVVASIVCDGDGDIGESACARRAPDSLPLWKIFIYSPSTLNVSRTPFHRFVIVARTHLLACHISRYIDIYHANEMYEIDSLNYWIIINFCRISSFILFGTEPGLPADSRVEWHRGTDSLIFVFMHLIIMIQFTEASRSNEQNKKLKDEILP